MNRILLVISRTCAFVSRGFGLRIIVLVMLVTSPALPQTFSLMYNFGSNPGDPNVGIAPGTIVQGRDGNIYTTSQLGGANNGGTIFQITPGGGLTVLYNFDGTHGSLPFGGLTLGTDGNFYGTTVIKHGES